MARVTLGDRLQMLASSQYLSQRDRTFAESLLSHYLVRRSLTSGRRKWVDRLEAKVEESKNRDPSEYESVVADIDDVMTRVDSGSWAANFLDSIRSQAIRSANCLSPRQQEIFDTIKFENSPAEVEKRATWHLEYEKTWQDTAKILSHYYRAQTARYYSNIVEDIEGGRVPNRCAFLKMVNNKYAKKVMCESAKPARFDAGTHIAPNSRCGSSCMQPVDNSRFNYEQFRQFEKHGGFIMDSSKFIVSAARGAKRYKVLAVGSTVPFWIEERYVKLFPRVRRTKSHR